MIVTTKVTHGLLYNIVNYDKYQDSEITKVTTNGQRRLQKGSNSNKNGFKNDKNDINKTLSENSDEVSEIKSIIDYLNKKSGKKYKHTTPKTKSLINARLREGFKVSDFKIVIDKKIKEWTGTEFERYIRPDTLFSNKLEGYLNQNVIDKKKDFRKFIALEKLVEMSRESRETDDSLKKWRKCWREYKELVPEYISEYVKREKLYFDLSNSKNLEYTKNMIVKELRGVVNDR